MLKVSEIFVSIQGEGIDIGMPMSFVRFSGCNLNCQWCDTPYASSKSSNFSEYSWKEILQKILKEKIRGVCFTGGEPFIQPIEELFQLTKMLAKNRKFIDVQTNGVAYQQKFAPYISRFSISPKFPSSQVNKTNSIHFKTLQSYVDQHAKYENILFKFVIENENTIKDVFKLLDKLKRIKQNAIPVIFQPQIDNKTSQDINKQKILIKNLIENEILDNERRKKYSNLNFRIIPQVHKILWGNKKGV